MSSDQHRARWKVAVNAPISKLLTYFAPQENLSLAAGDSVIVPLGKRKVDAVLVETTEEESKFEIKEILEKHSERISLSQKRIEWLRWISTYYCHPIGQVMQLSFPPLKKKGRGSRKGSVTQELATKIERPVLTDEQEKVFSDIKKVDGFAVHLLHGVTGSGKTEVYLHLLEEVLKKGQQGLVLVPEISLTPQLTDRFVQRFGPEIAVIHSHLTEREKTEQWWSMIDGKKSILVGARSALFCPLENVGMIILDEEHEPSFKQEEKLKYHARDTAIMLANKSNCPVVLGSATPSLESWHNTQSKKFHLHQMQRRVGDRAMPEIEMIDLKITKGEEKKDDLPFWMSPQLKSAITDTLKAGNQTALFLNRRGIAQTVTCTSCGDTRECPNCAVSLTLHGKTYLICHYCGYHEDKKDICSECGEGEPQPLGLGTERIENDLTKLFPGASLARADRDEIHSREQMEDLILDMESGKTDILIGTQMIAKGLDFPKLTLVGLVLADIGFNLPDFRSGERIYQLVTQVSGRAGRHVKPGEAPGRVIVQTYNPEHPTLQLALKNDFSAFADYEISFRQALNYPPFQRMASLRIQAPELSIARKAAENTRTMSENLKKQFEKYADIEVLGPVEAPMLKLRNQFRFQILIKGPKPWEMVQFCQHLLDHSDRLPNKSRLIVDVDPASLL